MENSASRAEKMKLSDFLGLRRLCFGEMEEGLSEMRDLSMGEMENGVIIDWDCFYC